MHEIKTEVLATLIDTEGCIRRYIEKTKYPRYDIVVLMKFDYGEYQLLSKMSNYLKALNIYHYLKQVYCKKDGKNYWMLRISRTKDVLKLLLYTYPYLTVKKKKAELILREKGLMADQLLTEVIYQ